MENLPFDIVDYLKSIVGPEHFNIESAKVRFDFANTKNRNQVTAVWGLVLSLLYLEGGDVRLAKTYLDEGFKKAESANEEGLITLYSLLNEKFIDLSQCSPTQH